MLRSNLYRFFIIALLAWPMFTLNSCGNSTDESDDIVVDDDYYEFQDFALKSYEIPAMISLPDETANIGASTKPEVIHVEDDIKWEIIVGPNFQLMIEDYGDITDLIEVEKKDIADKKFFKVKYLIDEEDMILYERTLSDLYHAWFSETVSDDDWDFASEYIQKYLIDKYEKETIDLWEVFCKKKNPLKKEEETEGFGGYAVPAFEMKPDHVHFKHQYNEETELTEKCWKGYTQKGMKTMFGKRYPNCVKKKK